MYTLVTRTLRELGAGWEEAPEATGPGFNLQWTCSSKARVDLQDGLVWQRVNHFPGIKELTRKDLLKRHMSRCRQSYGVGRNATGFDLMPQTFSLPKEYVAFVDAFNRARDGQDDPGEGGGDGVNFWIMKPVNLSRGRGIYLVNDAHSLGGAEHRPAVHRAPPAGGGVQV